VTFSAFAAFAGWSAGLLFGFGALVEDAPLVST
jgi:hypothetical protein